MGGWNVERKEGKANGMTLLRLLTPSFPPAGPPTSPSGCPSRMSTKLEALEQCPWVVWRLVRSSPAWLSPSPLSTSPLRSSPSRCTMSPCPRPSPATTLASTSRTCRSRYQERLRHLRLQEQACHWCFRLHRPGHRAEPPRTGVQWLLSSARLSHRPHCL